MKSTARSLSIGRLAARPAAVVLLLACLGLSAAPGGASAQVIAPTSAASDAASTSAGSADEGASSLESAASRAGTTGRKVAMSLIGLAFAIASIVLAFRRDFKEAAGVFAVGIVAVLLASPTGLTLLRDTVDSLFGS